MIKIKHTGKFDRMLEDLVKDNRKLLNKVEASILLFINKPTDTRLENHPLRKRLKGKWAFNIDDDVRIVYEWKSKNVVRFLAIGGHHEVYRKPKKSRFIS